MAEVKIPYWAEGRDAERAFEWLSEDGSQHLFKSVSENHFSNDLMWRVTKRSFLRLTMHDMLSETQLRFLDELAGSTSESRWCAMESDLSPTWAGHLRANFDIREFYYATNIEPVFWISKSGKFCVFGDYSDATSILAPKEILSEFLTLPA